MVRPLVAVIVIILFLAAIVITLSGAAMRD
jgi:hypothetical protein